MRTLGIACFVGAAVLLGYAAVTGLHHAASRLRARLAVPARRSGQRPRGLTCRTPPDRGAPAVGALSPAVIWLTGRRRVLRAVRHDWVKTLTYSTANGVAPPVPVGTYSSGKSGGMAK